MYVRRPCSCTVARGLSVRKEKKGIAKKRYTAPMYGAHVRLKVFIVEKKRKEKDHKKIGVRRHFLQARPSRRHPIGKNMFCRLYFAATSGVCLIAAEKRVRLRVRAPATNEPGRLTQKSKREREREIKAATCISSLSELSRARSRRRLVGG